MSRSSPGAHSCSKTGRIDGTEQASVNLSRASFCAPAKGWPLNLISMNTNALLPKIEK